MDVYPDNLLSEKWEAKSNNSKTTEPHSLLSSRGNTSYSTVGHTDLLVYETVSQQSHGN